MPQTNCAQIPELLEMVTTLKFPEGTYDACREQGQPTPSKSPGPTTPRFSSFQFPLSSFLLVFNPNPFQSTHHVIFLGTSKEGSIKSTEERVWTEYAWKRDKLQLRLVHVPCRQNFWRDEVLNTSSFSHELPKGILLTKPTGTKKCLVTGLKPHVLSRNGQQCVWLFTARNPVFSYDSFHRLTHAGF